MAKPWPIAPFAKRQPTAPTNGANQRRLGLTGPGASFIRFNAATSVTATLDHIRTILAHEVFHCMRAASFKDATLGTDAFDIAPANCKDIHILPVVRFDTDTIPIKYPRPLNAFRYLPCWKCEELPKMDQCLVGTWRLSTESLISFLQSRRVTDDVNDNSMAGQIVLTMNSDGSAQWLAEDVSILADYLPKSLARMIIPFYITVEALGMAQAMSVA